MAAGKKPSSKKPRERLSDRFILQGLARVAKVKAAEDALRFVQHALNPRHRPQSGDPVHQAFDTLHMAIHAEVGYALRDVFSYAFFASPSIQKKARTLAMREVAEVMLRFNRTGAVGSDWMDASAAEVFQQVVRELRPPTERKDEIQELVLQSSATSPELEKKLERLTEKFKDAFEELLVSEVDDILRNAKEKDD